ncbi:MAG TPA: hypothetical protein VN653_15825 [Anaerolineales bacterium]|nr:hypothetical protein [Anaerolineales bacterium]
MRAAPNLILIVIIILSMVIGSSVLARGHEWGDDFAAYIMQGQSILNGKIQEFVERNTFTVFESSIQIGPVAYPWGYPLILTPALALKGVHPLALKIPGLLFFAGFLICLYLMTINHLTRTESLLLVSVFAFNPVLVKFLNQILSDIPFLFFIYLGLLWVAKRKAGIWNSIGLGVVIFLAFFIRTTGIILLASFLVYQALCFFRQKEGRREILINSVAVVISFLLLWIISSLIFPSGQGSYFEQLKGLTPKIFRENPSYYFSLFRMFFGSASAWTFVYYFLIVLFLIGLWKRRNEDQLLISFFVLYLVAMLFWPERQGIRFIFPLLPVFAYIAFHGVRTILNILPQQQQAMGSLVFSGCWLVMIGTFLFQSGSLAYANLQDGRQINGPFDPFSSDVYNYINEETPPDSIIVFFKPRAMRLFTNRDSVMIFDCDRLTIGDYIVISKKAENSQVPPNEINQCGLPLRNIFENQRFIIYELPK